MRGSIAIIIACVGCSTVNTSTLPPYVRDLRAGAGGIDMVQCRITFKEETTRSLFWRHSSTERTISEGSCWRTVVPTAVADIPASSAPPALSGGAR